LISSDCSVPLCHGAFCFSKHILLARTPLAEYSSG
jgi:hypothetical protein